MWNEVTKARRFVDEEAQARRLRQRVAFIKRTEKKLIDQGKDVSNKDIIWNEIIDNSMHGREDVDKLFNLYDL